MRYAEPLLWAISILSLLAAAQVNTRSYLLVIAIVWVASTIVVIPLHFYRAWRRWPEVPNQPLYAAWVGLETVGTLVLIGPFAYSMASR
jgi:hypothetical protein